MRYHQHAVADEVEGCQRQGDTGQRSDGRAGCRRLKQHHVNSSVLCDTSQGYSERQHRARIGYSREGWIQYHIRLKQGPRIAGRVDQAERIGGQRAGIDVPLHIERNEWSERAACGQTNHSEAE